MAVNATTRAFANASQKLLANATVNTSKVTTAVSEHTDPNWFVAIFTVAIPSIASRFWDLLSAPFVHSHMQWIIIPLILTFTLTEFYFFRHTEEELGWNAALVNSLVLVFIAIDLTKTIFEGLSPWAVLKLFGTSLLTGEHFSTFMVIGFIGGLGLALAIVNYFHLLPRRIAYIVSSHPPINFIAYVAIAIVYSRKHGHPIPLDGYLAVAATILFTILVAIIFTIQKTMGTKNFSYYGRE